MGKTRLKQIKHRIQTEKEKMKKMIHHNKQPQETKDPKKG